MPSAASPKTTVLAPERTTRIGNLVGGVLQVILGIALAILGYVDLRLGSWFWAVFALGIVLALYGLVVAIRGPKLSVTLTADAATVRGYFGTRTIPRELVVGMSGFPSIVWVDAAQSRHKTPVNALNVRRRGAVLPEVLQRIDEMTRTLADWVDSSEKL